MNLPPTPLFVNQNIFFLFQLGEQALADIEKLLERGFTMQVDTTNYIMEKDDLLHLFLEEYLKELSTKNLSSRKKGP